MKADVSSRATDGASFARLQSRTKSTVQLVESFSVRRKIGHETTANKKGALVTTDHLTTLVGILYRHDAILHCCAFDVARHGAETVNAKANQGEASPDIGRLSTPAK